MSLENAENISNEGEVTVKEDVKIEENPPVVPIPSIGSTRPPQPKPLINKDVDFLTWHKINLYSTSGVTSTKELSIKIQDALGFPVKFYVWHKMTPRSVEFYIKGRPLANAIGEITTLKGITFKVSGNPQNPPAARMSSVLKEMMGPELISRYNSLTGHLNMSNFAETNGLADEFWLPIHKHPLIRSAINEIIMLNESFNNLASIDLSFNKLSTFDDFDFLTKRNITVLIANDNLFHSISVMEPLKDVRLTELDVQNNPFEDIPEGGVDNELKKMFPTLVILNPEPLGPTNRPNNSESAGPPPKIPRISEAAEESAPTTNSNNNKRVKENKNVKTSYVISLERQLTESVVQMKNWTVMVQDLGRRQRKTEDHLKRMQQENQLLQNEVGFLRNELEWAKGQINYVNERWAEHPYPYPHQASSSQSLRRTARREQPQPPPLESYHYDRARMAIPERSAIAERSSTIYPYARRPRSPDPTAETLEDISHMFDRPVRN